jgi:chromosome segregation ATPase
VQRSAERNATKNAFLLNVVGPYMQREESRQAHRQEAERRAEAAEAEVTSLRRELDAAGEAAAGLRDEVIALRDAATQAEEFIKRLRDAEAEATRAKELLETALERRDYWRKKYDAEFKSRAVTLQERDDAVKRAVAAERSLAPVRNERDLARQEIVSLRSSLDEAESQTKKLQKGQKEDAKTMTRLREERSAAWKQRDRARDEVDRLKEKLERAQADLASRDAEMGELSRAAAVMNEFSFGTAGASGSSTANRLAEVPNVVRRAIAEGLRLGSFLTLMSAGGLYENLDLAAISRGYSNVRTAEEMVALSQVAETSAITIASRVPADAVMETVRSQKPRAEDGREDQRAGGHGAP